MPHATGQRVAVSLDDALMALAVAALVNREHNRALAQKIIKIRLSLTDKYLEGKAKTCEAVLKKMSFERKKIAKEQIEARKMLKDLRSKYNY